MTFACTVVAKSMTRAVIQACARHQTAVVTRPSWIAVALALLTVALSMVVAIVGTLFLPTSSTTVTWGAVARTIETLAIWFAASLHASLNTAIIGGPAFRAVALLAPFITDTIATAVIGAKVHLGLTLNSNEPSGTQTVTIMTLATVGGTITVTCFLSASVTLPSNLAQASGIITTVSILTVRADGLRAILSSITNITFTSSCHTITATVTRASVGAHLLLAGLAHEPRGTIADTVNTAAVSGTVSRTALQ